MATDDDQVQFTVTLTMTRGEARMLLKALRDAHPRWAAMFHVPETNIRRSITFAEMTGGSLLSGTVIDHRVSATRYIEALANMGMRAMIGSIDGTDADLALQQAAFGQHRYDPV